MSQQVRATFVEGLEARQLFAVQPMVLGPANPGPSPSPVDPTRCS